MGAEEVGQDVPRTPREVVELAELIGRKAEPFAAGHDRDNTFVEEGYAAIRETGFGKIAVPTALGGGGHDLETVCRAQAMLARYCASTSLAIAMHHHNVLSLAWRSRVAGAEADPLLSRIAADGLLLGTSGAMDPNNPGVAARLAPGGVVVSGRKGLASGAPGIDLLGMPAEITIDGVRRVIAVFAPMASPGVQIVPKWDAMGMRGSGSYPVHLTDAFVPAEFVLGLEGRGGVPGRRRFTQAPNLVQSYLDGSIDGLEDDDADDIGDLDLDDLEVPEDVALADLGIPDFPPGLFIAVTVIGSVYLGIAAGARDRALRAVLGSRKEKDPATERLAGLMSQELRTAWWALEGMIRLTDDDSLLGPSQFLTTMLGKRQVVLSSIAVVEAAIQMLGTAAYLRDQPFEQALRDIRAGLTHPVAPEATLVDTGRLVLAAARAKQAAGDVAGNGVATATATATAGVRPAGAPAAARGRKVPPVPPPRGS